MNVSLQRNRYSLPEQMKQRRISEEPAPIDHSGVGLLESVTRGSWVLTTVPSTFSRSAKSQVINSNFMFFSSQRHLSKSRDNFPYALHFDCIIACLVSSFTCVHKNRSSLRDTKYPLVISLFSRGGVFPFW